MRKNWLWYQFFRYPLVGFGLTLFYKKIEVAGRENLPKNKPVLLVVNHQNSFMDAILIVTRIRPFIYFLTRAQAFNPPIMNWFLRSLNMLPVYRVRDGLSSVTKNKEVFEECVRYMKRNDAILIFPEANHDLKRRIRPLSKGFTRIAFDAEVTENWEMGLHIIPVGLNYEEHRKARRKMRMVFGEPIVMKKYETLFKEDERNATNLLKEEVAERMKTTVMHVENDEHYPVHDLALVQLEQNPDEFINPEKVNAKVAKVEEKLTPEIVEKATNAKAFAEKRGIDIKAMNGRKKPLFWMILLFPLFLFAWLNNILPYRFTKNFIKKNIKDPAFDASIKVVFGIFVFPTVWLLTALIIWLIGMPGWWVVGYLGLSVVTSTMFKTSNALFEERAVKKHLEQIKQKYPEDYSNFTNALQDLNEFRAEVLAK